MRVSNAHYNPRVKSVLYIHGFASSPLQSQKLVALQRVIGTEST